METNNYKNSNNNDGEDKQQQLRGSAQNRSNLANDEDKPTATGEDQNCSSNKNLEEGNDLNLEVESLSREELVNLVRKQMATIMEMKTQKQETIKKEAEESSSRQAEEFSQRIVQLEQEKAEVHKDLSKKLAEIEEMHKEVEEKSKQIDALLMQLNESTSHQHQIGLPTEEQDMKIQLPLENWFDLLALVPRSQLGQIVSQIGDRRFARIIQAFLHEHGEITLGKMVIIRPRRSVPSDRPMVKGWPLPDWPMPGNIKNFEAVDFNYCYMDMFVLDFLRKFQQNYLLANVNLHLKYHLTEDVLLRILAQILPLIDSINSINSDKIDIDLIKMAYKNNSNNNNEEDGADDEGEGEDGDDEDHDEYEYGNSNVSHQSQLMLKTMMEQTRVLEMPVNWCRSQSQRWIDWCCSWLYTPREDGKPRMLKSYSFFRELTHLSSFTERIIKDFKIANKSSSFLIRIYSDQNKNVPHICFNTETNEKLVIKTNKLNDRGWQMVISRYPSEAAKDWIEANEKEICNSDEREVDRKLILEEEYIY